MEKLPSGEPFAIRQHSFAFAIKAVLRALFGRYFDDNEKVQSVRKNYDVVSDIGFAQQSNSVLLQKAQN